MSMKHEELKNKTDAELIALYDKAAGNTIVGINYYAEELSRRRIEKSNKLMIKLTKWITIMTAIMLLSTIANVIIAIAK